jgi:hypothetical protein
MTPVPARTAGLEPLHEFLERGYSAFKALPDPQSFVATVTVREKVLLDPIYNDRLETFD